MGPRLFSRGNPGNTVIAPAAEMASMGPRLFSRGNMTLTVKKADLPGPKMLQWGHDFSAVEISEGPGQGYLLPRFNGATTFQPWKFPTYTPRTISPNVALQWGHDFSAVEIPYIYASNDITKRGASMGPRLFSRGNFGRPGPGISFATLQWGHDFSAVEIEVGSGIGLVRRGASMGPRLFSRGNSMNSCGVAFFAMASMGPRLFSRGNHLSCIVEDVALVRFNGATTFQPWKSLPSL